MNRRSGNDSSKGRRGGAKPAGVASGEWAGPNTGTGRGYVYTVTWGRGYAGGGGGVYVGGVSGRGYVLGEWSQSGNIATTRGRSGSWLKAFGLTLTRLLFVIATETQIPGSLMFN